MARRNNKGARLLRAAAALALLCCAAGSIPAALAQVEVEAAQPGAAPSCVGKCGQGYLPNGSGGFCGCDYWCDNRGDCCGGVAAKAAACPDMVPTLSKPRITTCDSGLADNVNNTALRTNYRAGMCWCDQACAAAGDCCATCSTCAAAPPRSDSEALVATAALAAGGEDDPVAAAEAAAEMSLPLFAEVQARAAELAAAAPEAHDCGAAHGVADIVARARARRAGAGALPAGLVDVATAANSLRAAEQQMQACQAADRGVPETPIRIPLYWTAGQVCPAGTPANGSGCVGGKYSKALVQKQVDLVNGVWAHAGIQFDWDGVIHYAAARSIDDIDVGYSTSDWICQQKRQGPQVSINVMTSPEHPSGGALGVTLYPSYFATNMMPRCANWLYIYEKTLPGQGGRSTIDGLLADGGAVLTHEIGHQMMLAHTWNQAGGGTVAQQCSASASLNPSDIVNGASDGVRDTTAQVLNSTNNPVTNILRFVGCDIKTGAYTNTTANAQQSCTSASGFPQGDSYYNNYNNLMSYGDKTCLRTLTPGQGARARCAYKCQWLMAC